MSVVSFSTDVDGGHWWKICDDENEINHSSHDGFETQHDAIQNLFMNHAMMGIFVSAVARGLRSDGEKASGVFFDECYSGSVQWKIKNSHNDIIGQSCSEFVDVFDAMDNLIIVYTMLSVFVASIAQDRAANP